MKSIRALVSVFALGLFSFACASAPEEQAPVTTVIDDMRVSSTKAGDVITSTLTDGRDAGRELAILEWNVVNGTARMRLMEKGVSVSIRPDGATATLETANVVARRAYEIAASVDTKPASSGSPGAVEPRLLEAFCVSCHAVGQSDICCGWDLWC